jgi:hypothetical protein
MPALLGIDHPLVLVRDIEAMAARYRSLGFNTAPTGRHPWGTSTSLIMFDRQALELMGIYDEALLDSHAVGSFRFGRHMAEALAEREGVSLVALYSTDATADRARLEARGLAAQGRVDFRRKVKLPGRDWDEAVVSLEILVDPAMPRASNFLCQQHRPELVWVPEWLEHPNGAIGFAGITYATTEPDRLLHRLALLFGAEAIQPAPFGYEARTANGAIRVAAPGLWAAHVGAEREPDITPVRSACIGIDVRVRDVGAVRRFVDAAGFSAVERDGAVTLSQPGAFGNVVLRFVGAHG